MALHKNYVKANIILAASTDAIHDFDWLPQLTCVSCLKRCAGPQRRQKKSFIMSISPRSFCSRLVVLPCILQCACFFNSMVSVCSDDQILDDESEGMRIVAHPNENITRHLSENALFIES